MSAFPELERAIGLISEEHSLARVVIPSPVMVRSVVGGWMATLGLIALSCGSDPGDDDERTPGGAALTGGRAAGSTEGGAAGQPQPFAGRVNSSGGGAGRSSGGVGALGGSGGSADVADAGEGGATSGPSSGRYFESGTRLKPRVLRAGDLEILEDPFGWHDTVTNLPCSFLVGADGVERCYPGAGIAQLTYSDVGCTQPAIRRTPVSCDGTRYQHVTLTNFSGCGHQPYRLSAELPPSSRIYYRNPDDDCVAMAPSAALEEIWELEERPPGEFVAMQRASRAWHPQMSASVREGEDGSWEVVGFIDSQREGPCFALSRLLTPHVCVPSWASPSGSFSDVDCSSRVASADSYRCLPGARTTFLSPKASSESCPAAATFDLWEMGEALETELYADLDGDGSCEQSSSGKVEVLTQGPAIDVATLPALDVVEVGTGPLRARFHGFDGVPFVAEAGPGGTFFEADSGAACKPLAFSDGNWRCVPSAYYSTTEADFFYQSPGCDGDRLFAWSASLDCPESTPAPEGVFIVQRDVGACGSSSIAEVLEFDGSAEPPNTLYRKVEAGCVAATAPAGPLLVASKPLDPAETFIEVERAIGD